jgi:hypothetical protein
MKESEEDFQLSTSLLHDIKDIILSLKKTNEDVKELIGRINIIELENCNLRNLLDDLCDMHRYRIKIPHRCPVCNGLILDNEGTLCQVCDGNGVVWG